ncbi:hypothetical protein ACET3Z_012757 [Daucus carota]
MQYRCFSVEVGLMRFIRIDRNSFSDGKGGCAVMLKGLSYHVDVSGNMNRTDPNLAPLHQRKYHRRWFLCLNGE